MIKGKPIGAEGKAGNTMEVLVVLPLAIAVASCIECIKQARAKGYSAAGFGLMGLIFGVIGLIVALLAPDRSIPSESQNVDTLVNYKRLLDAGVITDAEFAQKKEELLRFDTHR